MTLIIQPVTLLLNKPRNIIREEKIYFIFITQVKHQFRHHNQFMQLSKVI